MALGTALEGKILHPAGSDIENAHRPQPVRQPFERRPATAARQQQKLMQVGEPVRGELPVMQRRMRGDGFAIHDIGRSRTSTKSGPAGA